jgi:hypothetical protein
MNVRYWGGQQTWRRKPLTSPFDPSPTSATASSIATQSRPGSAIFTVGNTTNGDRPSGASAAKTKPYGKKFKQTARVNTRGAAHFSGFSSSSKPRTSIGLADNGGAGGIRVRHAPLRITDARTTRSNDPARAATGTYAGKYGDMWRKSHGSADSAIPLLSPQK